MTEKRLVRKVRHQLPKTFARLIIIAYNISLTHTQSTPSWDEHCTICTQHPSRIILNPRSYPVIYVNK
jgi:hypothetical protein